MNKILNYKRNKKTLTVYCIGVCICVGYQPLTCNLTNGLVYNRSFFIVVKIEIKITSNITAYYRITYFLYFHYIYFHSIPFGFPFEIFSHCFHYSFRSIIRYFVQLSFENVLIAFIFLYTCIYSNVPTNNNTNQ